MKTFAGFTPGPSRPIALPEAFFTDLLPLIDDLGELQVTLACFRIVTRKAGSPRAIRAGFDAGYRINRLRSSSFVTASRMVPLLLAVGSSGSWAMFVVPVATETLYTLSQGHLK